MSSQSYGFSSSHIWMWELDWEENWAPKNWCFWTVVLEKTLKSPLDCKEIQPVHSEGDQPWDFFGRDDAKAETAVLWPPHAKCWLIGKDSDAGRDWRQEEKGTTEDEMAGWHHGLDGRESEWTPGDGDGQGGPACCDSWGRKESDTTERLNWTELNHFVHVSLGYKGWVGRQGRAEDSGQGLQLVYRGRFEKWVSGTLPGQASELSWISCLHFYKNGNIKICILGPVGISEMVSVDGLGSLCLVLTVRGNIAKLWLFLEYSQVLKIKRKTSHSLRGPLNIIRGGWWGGKILWLWFCEKQIYCIIFYEKKWCSS